MTRRTSIALAIAALATFAVASNAEGKADFSGEWKLNTDKSNFGPIPAPDKMIRKVKHDDPSIKISTMQSGQQGETTTELAYTTDGKESVNMIRGSEAKSTAKWVGDQMVVDTKRDMQGAEITQKETWTLSKDGKTLTINNHINAPQGEFDILVVMDKQ